MAKKSKRERLVGSVEPYILYIYDTGIVQSTIAHTIILICMALITFTEPPDKKIALVLSFVNETTDVLQEAVIDVSLDQEEINEEVDSQTSKWSADNITEYTQPDEPGPIAITYEEVQKSSLDTPDFSIEDLNMTVGKEDKLDEPVTDTGIGPVPKPEISSKPKDQRYASRRSAAVNNNNKRRNVFGAFDSFGGGSQNTIMNQQSGAVGTGNNQYGDIGRRLSIAGAKTGDIQISIAWNTIDDIDLHVLTHNKITNSHISWMNRTSMEGGCLDIDQNANPLYVTPTPVENVFWPKDGSPEAQYVVVVHYFRSWTGKRIVPVTVIVKVLDKTKVYQVNAVLYGEPAEVVSFTKQSFR